MQALAVGEQLGEGLGAAQRQRREGDAERRREPQRLAEPVRVAQRPRAVDHPHQAEVLEAAERLADLALIEPHHRIAGALLVAGEHHRVGGERVLGRGELLLLDQHRERAQRRRIEREGRRAHGRIPGRSGNSRSHHSG
ncbi:MAG: hypothetical protein RML12_06250 [Xanthomonadales bacterium]|nr:hypothetical protein [Xanthomonadales bacterium]